MGRSGVWGWRRKFSFLSISIVYIGGVKYTYHKHQMGLINELTNGTDK